MTSKEFINKISESNSPDWFKDLEVNFNLPAISFSKNFKGLSEFHKYLMTQVDGYDKIENLPAELNHSKTFFEKNLENLESFLNRYLSHNVNNLNSYWRNVTTQNSTYKITLSDDKVLTYNNEFISNLIEINQLDSSFTSGAFNYYSQKPIGTSKNAFVGALLAYEFENPKSILSKRHYSANKKIEELNSRVEDLLSQNESHLLESLEKSKVDYQNYINKIDDFKSDKESVFNDWFEGNEENKVLGVKKEFDDFKVSKELLFNTWFEGTEEENGAKQKITELQNKYKELLKLKEPAEYWKERAVKLRTQGWIAFTALLVFVVIVVWSLGKLLWKTPEQIYTSFFEGDKSAAIRWSIIYVTFISFMAFCIRAITKVMFSSFHLARDSEERNTLTYFYLSLINDADVEKEERQLIMQSLFSRADTGLLKDDSGPTMPNDLAGKLFGGK